MTREMGQRMAADASTIQGVARAVVCARDGDVLGATGDPEPQRAAALGSFLSGRGEAMTLGGDLRGLGRVVADSHLREVRVTGANGDVIVVESGQGLRRQQERVDPLQQRRRLLRGRSPLRPGGPPPEGPTAAA